MSIDLNKYNRLRERSDKSKSDVARAEGVLEEQMRKLKQEYNVDSIEQAEMLIQTLEDEERALEASYNEKLKAHEEKYGKL